MQENNERRNPFLLAPLLLLPILFIFGILSIIPFGNGVFPYVLAAILILVIFGGVLLLAWNLRAGDWLGACLKSRAPGGFSVCISAAAVMMMQSAMIRAFLIGDLYDYRTYALYGMTFESVTDSVGTFLLIYLALAVLPAFLEGFLFRGFFMYEYRYAGVLFSALMSSFLYAMAGLSISAFPVHFLNGILLCAVVFLTGNIFYSILAHLIYGLFALSLEKYFMFIAAETPALSFLILSALGLSCVIWFCGSADRILRARGQQEQRAPIRRRKGKFFVVLMDIFSAPMIWADIFCFALVAVLHIFLDA